MWNYRTIRTRNQTRNRHLTQAAVEIPEVAVETPEVAVEIQAAAETPAAAAETPAAAVETPAAAVETPAAAVETPAAEVTAAIVMRNVSPTATAPPGPSQAANGVFAVQTVLMREAVS